MKAKGLFVTGTGTDVGKTYVSALILKRLLDENKSAAYYKAAMSGNVRGEDGALIPGDACHVKAVSGSTQSLESMCPYVYEAAVSPHLAAAWEGGAVALDTVTAGYEALAETYEYILMEGSGGIVCPLAVDDDKTLLLEDVITALDLPCVIVADAGLGTINSVVLTAAYMHAAGIRVKGLIFNHYDSANAMHRDNAHLCERLTGLPIVAYIHDGDDKLDIDANALTSLFKGGKQ